jgi:hypothetical protein
VLGVGGVTYASGQITGADIKDGTVTSADVQNHTLKLRDFSAGATSGLVGPSGGSSAFKAEDTALTGSFATVLSLPLPAGNYVASVNGTVFEATNGATFADCELTASGTTAFGESATTIPAGGNYASVAAQAAFTAGADTTLTFSCWGTNAGINKVTITAIRVGRLHGG